MIEAVNRGIEAISVVDGNHFLVGRRTEKEGGGEWKSLPGGV